MTEKCCIPRPVRALVFSALNVAAVAACLVGCGGLETPQLSSAAPAWKSWLNSQWRTELRNPHHKKKKLLHVGVAGEDSGTVDVLDYRTGAIVGQVVLQDFYGPTALCSDRNGNVYVAVFGGGGYEIQAGTTSVIKFWSTHGRPNGCAVSKSGDVAFTNWDNGSSGGGSVEIFPGGGSTGTTYLGPGYNDLPAAYDDKGNLFAVCGNKCGKPELWELAAGGSSWKPLRSNRSMRFGAVEWDGKYLAILCGSELRHRACIEQVAVSGNQAKVVNRVQLSESSCSSDDSSHIEFSTWAENAKKPNGLTTSPTTEIAAVNGSCSPTPILVWPYPAGSAPKRTISTEPFWCDCGATIVDV